MYARQPAGTLRPRELKSLTGARVTLPDPEHVVIQGIRGRGLRRGAVCRRTVLPGRRELAERIDVLAVSQASGLQASLARHETRDATRVNRVSWRSLAGDLWFSEAEA